MQFRMAVIGWPLFADVFLKFAPEECRPCAEWYGETCYGRGLEADQALRLAAKLDSHIADETIFDYIAELVQEQKRTCGEAWLSHRDLLGFMTFLKSCGGFSIN
jgi:hypothetical protein